MRRHLLQRLLKPPVSSSRLPPRPVQSPCKTTTAFFSQSHRTTYQQRSWRYTTIPDPSPFGPSRTVRFFRSLLWASLFGAAGIVAVLVYRVNGYREQSKIQPDSAVDAHIAARIIQKMRTEPIIQALNADPEFSEVLPLAIPEAQAEELRRAGGSIASVPHFILTALRGARGMFPVAFYNKARQLLVMVVVCGFGTEGDLGLVHNGALTTLIEESIQLAADAYFPEGLTYKLSDLEVSFSSPVPPNGLFSITCMPASTIDIAQLAPSVEASKEQPDQVEGNLVHWPEWFDPQDWNLMANSIVAQVNMDPAGYPLNSPEGVSIHAVGRYQVSESDDWPPPQTPRRKAYYNIRD